MIAYLPAVVVIGLLTVNVLSYAVAAWRCRPRTPAPPLPDAPAISIVRPLAGLENYLEEMLRSNFELDYPEFELLLCVQRPDDPVIDLAKRLIATYPEVDARLLIGDEPFCANPKVNNCIKGWDGARHDLVIVVDSNVLMPRDYIWQHLRRLGPKVLVTFSPPIGARPENFWAEVECAFLNSLHARLSYVGDLLRLNWVQGKSVLFRRPWLERHGGICALGAAPAEDIALRRIAMAEGGRTRVVEAPFELLLGRRSAADVFRRQRRWALLRRLVAPAAYPLELVLSGVVLMSLAGLAALALERDPWIAALGAGAISYGAELFVAWRLGWLYSWRTPAAFLLRDSLIPVIWLLGLVSRGFRWGGFVIRTERGVLRLKGGFVDPV